MMGFEAVFPFRNDPLVFYITILYALLYLIYYMKPLAFYRYIGYRQEI